MSKLTYGDGTPIQEMTNHDIALIMTALRLMGTPTDDPEKIQHEFSHAWEWLTEFRRQPEIQSPEASDEGNPND